MIDKTFYNPLVLNVRINPTYSVTYIRRLHKNKPSYSNRAILKAGKTQAQMDNEKNLRNNATKGELSKKAVKKLRNAINWLTISAKSQKIRNSVTGKMYTFKVNMITLTLPFEQGKLTDGFIKRELLNAFLIFLKNRYDFNSYVWKAETQENGNIHFHIASDCYIPHTELRYYWNRLIIKKGLMKQYTNKFKNMTLEDYTAYSISEGTTDIEIIKKRFIQGKASNWENPNSTDVHSVLGVKDLAAYLATYMSKKEEGKRPVNGKLWGCSRNLSDSNKCLIQIEEADDTTVVTELENISKEIKEVETVDKLTGKPFYVCTVFIAKIEEILRYHGTQLREFLIKHIEGIRNYGKQPILNYVTQ